MAHMRKLAGISGLYPGSSVFTFAVNGGELPAGKYEEIFCGDHLSGGTYFYSLKAGEFIKTRKLLLLR